VGVKEASPGRHRRRRAAGLWWSGGRIGRLFDEPWGRSNDMGAITPTHLILILAVALLVIGPGRLPETGAALGRAIRQFRDALDGVGEDAAPASIPPAVEAPRSGDPPTA
jgi:sec-independent protein translocase protein TatA